MVGVKKRTLRVLLFFIAITGVCVVILFPFELVIAPERNLRLIDEAANPVQNALVRQYWDQYSLRASGGGDFRVNSEGSILLPKGSIRTNILSLILGAINELRQLGINASFQSTETIGIFADGYQEKWIYNGKGIHGGNEVKLFRFPKSNATPTNGTGIRLKGESNTEKGERK